MGPTLWRVLAGFSPSADPSLLVEWKRACDEVERAWAASDRFAVKRPINLDPGYVDLGKVVLASFKDFAHRIYLGQGVYAEVVLGYRRHQFESMPWTYPDYRSPEYLRFFEEVRRRLHTHCREQGAGTDRL
jgi:hypothetical protein